MMGDDIKSKSTYFSSHITGGKSTNIEGRSAGNMGGNARLRKGNTHIPTVKSEKSASDVLRVLKDEPENKKRVRIKRNGAAIIPSAQKSVMYDYDNEETVLNKGDTADLESNNRHHMPPIKSKSHVQINEYTGDGEGTEMT